MFNKNDLNAWQNSMGWCKSIFFVLFLMFFPAIGLIVCLLDYFDSDIEFQESHRKGIDKIPQGWTLDHRTRTDKEKYTITRRVWKR